jgi:ethanolamine utilization protein EutA
MNIDMGGGTAKLAICRNGEVLETAAINVGARLVAMDPRSGVITRIEPAGYLLADELGIPLEIGGTLSEDHQRAMAELLAECLMNVVERGPLDPLTDRLMITAPLAYRGNIDAVGFSGGVSEYVYGTEPRSFGDLGQLLGKAMADRIARLNVPLESPEQMIRATVIGAGQYTLQVSGSTIYVSRPELLPHRNLQVVTPVQPGADYTFESALQSIEAALQRLDVDEGVTPIALSFKWRMEPSYNRVKTLADAIVAALPNTIAAVAPLTIVFDTDIGGAVGNILTREVIPGHDIVSIDEVTLGDLDYIDLGEILEEVHAVPVVVKSLVFATARERASGLMPGAARPHAHHDHDHDGHGHDHDHNHPHDHTHAHDHDHAHDHAH